MVIVGISIILILFIVEFFIGFYLGIKLKNKVIEEKIERVVEKIRHPVGISTLTPGVIKRPSAQDLNYRKDEKYQEREAVRETLDSIPELREARKKMEIAKKEGIL